jgi:RNA polymerase sigma factor (sigma-70 family)
MDESAWMARRFEEHRSRLRAVAYRMLGSMTDADDAVQEAWLRLSRAGSSDVENLRAWLTTVVARVCLNVLRSRESRREEPVTSQLVETIAGGDDELGLEDEMMLADSVGLALLVVLERLPPAERLAFVLHDMFDVPFDEIASIVGRSPVAARQLASRARRRIQGAPAAPVSDQTQRQRAVEAFLAASRNGDFAGLLAVLDPEVVLRLDRGPRQESTHGPTVVRGAARVVARARAFPRFARFCRIALVNGAPGIVMALRGQLVTAMMFKVENGKIVEIEIVNDPARQRELELGVLDERPEAHESGRGASGKEF